MRWICVLVWSVAALSSFAQNTLKLPCIADNSIVLYKGEEHLNAGKKTRIRIKGNQHIVAMAFDTSAIKGKSVASATLVCTKADKDISGVTISTIQAPWHELKSNALTDGLTRSEGWGVPGIKFPAVCGGNSFSLFCHSTSVVRNGQYHWTVRGDLVEALATGMAFGLAIHEDSCDYSRNPTIYSREENGKRPYLLVTLGATPPGVLSPSAVSVRGDGDPDGVQLHFVGQSALSYDISVNGTSVPRWNIPFAKPKTRQVAFLRDFAYPAPGSRATVAITPVSRIGERGQPHRLQVTWPRYTPPVRPSVRALPPLPASRVLRGFSILPAQDRYDSSGKPVGQLPDDYRERNAVWHGDPAIRLRAARGEVTGFQVLLTLPRTTVTCSLPGVKTVLSKAVYVEAGSRRIPDPLIEGKAFESGAKGPTALLVDVYVPFAFKPRQVKGTLNLSSGQAIPIVLDVRNFALPREASFLCEMNSYGVPNKVESYYALQRLAADHRVHCNILHYSHSTAAAGARKSHLDMMFDDGRRMNEKRYNNIEPGAKTAWWDDFIKAFDPCLTGQLTAASHRGPVPPPGFYLTFHESWPLNVRPYFSGSPDAFQAFKAHPEYSETYVNILRDFASVARRQEWNHVGFQVYLNNKGSLHDKRKNPWILDEPTSYWDYRALAYYGRLTRYAVPQAGDLRLAYRIDISRPQFTRGQLAGHSDLWVVSSGAFRNYERLLADRRVTQGEAMWMYGTASKVDVSARDTMAWVLEAWLKGARGVVPWQTINKNGQAMQRADQLGLFIFDSSAGGDPVIRPTMRLKAFRRAQQDIEYLELARARAGWTPLQARRFVEHYVTLTSTLDKQNAADAGTVRYADVTPEAMRRLREACAAIIEGR